MNNQRQNEMREDEIDLKELLQTLVKHKIKIVSITLVITIFAFVYVLLTPKIYEAKAVFKIGGYKSESVGNTHPLDDITTLTKELEILYIDRVKNEKNRESWIEKISTVAGHKNIFEISAQGFNKKLAEDELLKVSEYIQQKHQKILDDVFELKKSQIKQVQDNLVILKTKKLPSLQERITRYTKDIAIYEKNFLNIQKNLKKIQEDTPILAALQINEQRYVADMLMSLKNSLEKFELEKSDIEFIQLAKLEEQLNTLHSLMKEHNYKNTEVIGNIMLNEHPVAPKKKLIVLVAFVTGLLFSIFFVFFLEFIRGFREEKKEL